jgi:hypothetical protein
LAGLSTQSQACYKTNAFDLYCLNFDLAASYLDQRFATAMHINSFPYFDAAHVLKRARPVFAHARWTMHTSNSYLDFASSATKSEIDIRLATQLSSADKRQGSNYGHH